MGELKIIIWIVLGIIYIVSRARKKKPDATPRPQEEHHQERPVSFEDLLREIQSSKTPKEIPPVVIEPVADFPSNNYDAVREEKQPLEKTDYSYRDHDSIYETYEKAKQEAFLRPSMEETLKLENTIVRFGQFKGYEQQPRPSLARQYGNDLKDPENFRKAFILSEILNRRY